MAWRSLFALAPSCATWNSCSSTPRCSISPAGSRSLITEAMRGEGARLVDRNGQRFMLDCDPRGELAPRDVVRPCDRRADGSHAASQRLSRSDASRFGRRPRPLSRYRQHVRLSSASTSRKIGFRCGPARTTWSAASPLDLEGRTTLPGLWAAGRGHLQRAARRQPSGIEQPCSKASSTAPTPAPARCARGGCD